MSWTAMDLSPFPDSDLAHQTWNFRRLPLLCESLLLLSKGLSLMADPVRVALFGNGFARTVMLPCFRQVEDLEVVGIAGPSVDRLRETAREFDIPHRSGDHREILEVAKPDLVFVATPPHRHLDQTIDALDAGCHVVCEKPTAMNASESRSMWEAGRSHPNRLTLIDHELRCDPRRQQALRWMKEGRLGKILHARYELSSPALRDPQRPWSWWSDAEQGGGVLGAIGSHAVDALRVFLGEVASVRGWLETVHATRPDAITGEPRAVTSDERAEGWIQFQSGATATLSLSVVATERVHRLTIQGSDGVVRLEEQRPLVAGFGGDPLEEISVEDTLPDNETLGIPDTDWARSFLRFSREIVTAIRQGAAGPSGDLRVDGAATFEDGHRNQMVLDAIRRSHEEARWEVSSGN